MNSLQISEEITHGNFSCAAAAESAPPSPSSEMPPPEELLKKIHELELGHALLKQEMYELLTSSAAEMIAADNNRSKHRSHSVPPRQFRTSGRDGGVLLAWKKRSQSFRRSSPLRRESRDPSSPGGEWKGESVAVNLTDKQYLDILQAMGQSIHIADINGRLIYWNRSAEILYGYTAEEALGRNGFDLLVDPLFYSIGDDLLNRVALGENWTGQFPVKNKRGERFSIVASDTALVDDAGTVIGVICVSSDSRYFSGGTLVTSEYSEAKARSDTARKLVTSELGVDHQQPLQTALASKISTLASKVSNKVKSRMRPPQNDLECDGIIWDGHHPNQGFRDANMSERPEDAASSESSTPRGNAHGSSFVNQERKSPTRQTQDSGDEKEGKPGISKVLTSKAESWIGKKILAWPWKGNEPFGAEPKPSRFAWPWSQYEQENVQGQKSDTETFKSESHVLIQTNCAASNEVSGSWSSSPSVNSTSSSSSFGSNGSGAVNKVEADVDSLDYEISWEDLTVGEQIGQGSCGTVYHGLWYGSDIAVKVFSRQVYSDDVIYSFRQEVSLMKRLRHPNILLFMGAVTSPQRLCIVSEFLPRGSLFRLLQKSASKLEKRRQIHIALDVARGMSYLHHFNPPIIHRDLKSSNLLVDKNWTVKVGDFGLSRLKHETYLTTKTGKGTPQWMAPEVLRNEPSDEKGDVYSYGVVLWEIVSQKIPWDHLNSMQVIGAVGFMNQRLEIPKDVDPQWASLIESCWHSEPKCRPSFQELVEKLKDMYREYTLQLQAGRAASDVAQNEL